MSLYVLCWDPNMLLHASKFSRTHTSQKQNWAQPSLRHSPVHQLSFLSCLSGFLGLCLISDSVSLPLSGPLLASLCLLPLWFPVSLSPPTLGLHWGADLRMHFAFQPLYTTPHSVSSPSLSLFFLVPPGQMGLRGDSWLTWDTVTLSQLETWW